MLLLLVSHIVGCSTMRLKLWAEAWDCPKRRQQQQQPSAACLVGSPVDNGFVAVVVGTSGSTGSNIGGSAMGRASSVGGAGGGLACLKTLRLGCVAAEKAHYSTWGGLCWRTRAQLQVMRALA